MRQVCLAFMVALYVATPMIPSEAAASQGTGLVLVMLWLILTGTWLADGILRGKFELRFGPAGLAMAALVGWHVVSAFAMAGQGSPRPAINMVWEWVALGLGFILARNLVRHESEVRAIIAVMLGAAVCIAVFSFYQYFYTMPQIREEYKKDPVAVMREAGIRAEPGSTQWDRFRNRVESREPSGTFALTNSLAAFYTPWIVMGVGLLLLAWQDNSPSRTSLAGIGLVLAPLFFSLLLAKSNAAIIGTAAGVALVWIYGRSQMGRTLWMAPLLALGLVVVMGIGALVSGGFTPADGTARLSFLYRLDYWRSTAELINQYPWYGTGPGNFQNYYTQFQLPNASENIADPHNFLLEIWATAGSPALLALFAVLGLFAMEVTKALVRIEAEEGKAEALGEDEEKSKGEGDEDPIASAEDAAFEAAMGRAPQQAVGPEAPAAYIYVGGVLGVVMALPLSFLAGFSAPTALVTFGLPLAAACVYLVHPWVKNGKFPLTLPSISVIALLITLLATGGINYPGVSGSLWLLLAVGLVVAESDKPRTILPGPAVILLLALVGMATISCYQTAYEPVLTARGAIATAEERSDAGDVEGAEEKLLQATKADPYSPEPWKLLADLRFRRWRFMPSTLREAPELHTRFEEAKDKMLALDKRDLEAHRLVGGWYFQVYRTSNDLRDLDAAIEAYRKGVELFPNSSYSHARLAWALHVKRDHAEAKKEADLALELNRLNTHGDRDLTKLRLDGEDPGPIESRRLESEPGPGARTADDLMREVAKA